MGTEVRFKDPKKTKSTSSLSVPGPGNYPLIPKWPGYYLSFYFYRKQILLIKNGACVYDESHGGIQMEEIAEQAAK